jgi:hypothetical protein
MPKKKTVEDDQPNIEKILVVDNPTNLPLLPLDLIVPFQGDLKKPPEPAALDKLVRSILDHHLFIGKAVFFENGVAYTEDGHQTLTALRRLSDLGYKTCEVVTYALIDGRMQESSRTRHDTIMVPYQVIVPRGETESYRRKDAAAKLLQINSQYAKINPATSFFKELEFADIEFDKLLSRIQIPDLDFHTEAAKKSDFLTEFESYNNTNCLYPIVPRFSEKYDCLIIVSENETDTAFLETVLQIRKEQSYKLHKNPAVGKSMVITAGRFEELWKSR